MAISATLRAGTPGVDMLNRDYLDKFLDPFVVGDKIGLPQNITGELGDLSSLNNDEFKNLYSLSDHPLLASYKDNILKEVSRRQSSTAAQEENHSILSGAMQKSGFDSTILGAPPNKPMGGL